MDNEKKKFKLSDLVTHGHLIQDADGKYRYADTRAKLLLKDANIEGDEGEEMEVTVEKMVCSKASMDDSGEDAMEEKDMDSGDEAEEASEEKAKAIRELVRKEIKSLTPKKMTLKEFSVSEDIHVNEPHDSEFRIFKSGDQARYFASIFFKNIVPTGLISRSLKDECNKVIQRKAYQYRAGVTMTTNGAFEYQPESYFGALFNLVNAGGVTKSVAQNVPLQSGVGRGFYPIRSNTPTLVGVSNENSIDVAVSLDQANVSMVARNFRGSVKISRALNADSMGLVLDQALWQLQIETQRKVDQLMFASTVNNGIVSLGAGLIASGSAGVYTPASASVDTVAELVRDDIINLMGLVKKNPEARANTRNLVWVCGADMAEQLRKLNNIFYNGSGSNVIVDRSADTDTAFNHRIMVVDIMDYDPVGGSSAVSVPLYFGYFPFSVFYGQAPNENELFVSQERYIDEQSLGVFANYRIAIQAGNFGNSGRSGPVGCLKLVKQ